VGIKNAFSSCWCEIKFIANSARKEDFFDSIHTNDSRVLVVLTEETSFFLLVLVIVMSATHPEASPSLPSHILVEHSSC
jgi:hypothetical protein